MNEDYIRGYIDAIEMAQAIVQFHMYGESEGLQSVFDDIGEVGESYRDALYEFLQRNIKA